MVQVRDFGAAGDGRQDDTEALQHALEEGDGTLHLAKGTYRITKPLVLDLTNPSGGIGWDNSERDSLAERGPVDCVMALALIHHLAISNNLPLNRIAAFFGKIGRSLIVEWVPKTDSQVRRLLTTRDDIFPDYTRDVFESAFEEYFQIQRCEDIRDSNRAVYLMSSG